MVTCQSDVLKYKMMTTEVYGVAFPWRDQTLMA
jgi:hypothetical protein